MQKAIHSPALKKWGYTGYALSVILSDCHNSIFVQCLENEWTEFFKILYAHYHGQGLRWDCNASFFANLQQSYCSWFMSGFDFAQYTLRMNGQKILNTHFHDYH